MTAILKVILYICDIDRAESPCLRNELLIKRRYYAKRKRLGTAN